MAQKNVISLDKIKVACRDCSLSTLCLPMGLRPDDVDRLDAIVKRNRPLQRGDHLFRAGEAFRNLYVVKTGAVKTFTQTNEGDEQVVGFHLPGEVLGLDAIQDGQHGCSARALETTAICELPFDRLEDLSSNIPSLQHQMFRLLSEEISHEAEMMALLGRSTAEERVASFLISLSERFKRRGFSATDFFLSMSRQEIGSYLGLALETVSRLFTRFQDEGILKVERKHVQILDLERLNGMVVHPTNVERHHANPST
ncbi:MAG: fumarate/nitrate reduction transcriptional regulator Fnr [Gammaproteobacteria bacterium]|nr:fumarate/nitrate reduction transcriptional regulator Fnr [Gammaproteobacteria bacterium]